MGAFSTVSGTQNLVSPTSALYGLKTLLQGAISLSGTGSITIVNGVSGKKTYIPKLLFVVKGAGGVALRNGTTDISGSIPFTDGGSFSYDGDMTPIIIDSGSDFCLNNSASLTLEGLIVYWQE